MADPIEPVLLSEPTPWGVRLTLNRPAKLNAHRAELRDALTAAIADAVADDRVRVIVLAGAGRAFCSGYDLTEEAERGTASGGWRGVLGDGCRGHPRDLALPEARHRPGPRLCARRRARARDGVRPDRRRRGRAAG